MKFLIKWILNGVIVVSLLLYYATDITFFEAAVAATALTLIAYFVGDQLILRATNNTVATLADAVMAIMVLWIAAYSMRWDINLGEICIIAIVLGIAEWLIHRYVLQARKITVQGT